MAGNIYMGIIGSLYIVLVLVLNRHQIRNKEKRSKETAKTKKSIRC